MSESIRCTALPDHWFDRRHYRPRVHDGDGEIWFVDSEAVHPLRKVPGPPARGEGSPRDLAVPRAKRREALLETYARWQLPLAAAVERNIQALGDEDTCVVVTGQQPGFLTGPLYTIYKALSAIALADKLSETWQRRCVPVFWVAGEDHDIDEIRQARFPGPDGEEVVFGLPHPTGRRPLSSLPVDRATEGVLDDVARHLAAHRFGEEARALIDLYRGRNLASGFAAILAELFGERGLVVLDPERLRPLAAPVFRRVLEDPAQVMERVREGCRLVEQHGIDPFVPPRFPLFVVREGSRDHVTWNGGGRLQIDGGGPLLDQAATIARLHSAPHEFSSAALLRPLVQEAILPGAVTIGGPAEVGYFAQLPPLSRWLGVDVPRIALRFQATLLEAKAARAWNRLGLDVDRFATAASPEDLVTVLADDAGGLLSEAKALEARARELQARLQADSTLDEAARKRIDSGAMKTLGATGRLVERVDRELRRSEKEAFGRATTLWNHVVPGGVLQERRWNVFHYISRYGTRWLGELLAQVKASLFTHRHFVVFFEAEGDDKP